MYGYAHRPSTCDHEDFPCCGCNDEDPSWEPDPSDYEDMLAELEDF